MNKSSKHAHEGVDECLSEGRGLTDIRATIRYVSIKGGFGESRIAYVVLKMGRTIRSNTADWISITKQKRIEVRYHLHLGGERLKPEKTTPCRANGRAFMVDSLQICLDQQL